MGHWYDVDLRLDPTKEMTTPSIDELAKAAMSELVRLATRQAMLDAWNEICADTDCHPLDITRHGKKLEFQPRHWADQTAAILENLLNAEMLSLSSRARREALEEAAKVLVDQIDWQKRLRDQGGATSSYNDAALVPLYKCLDAIRALSPQPTKG